MMTDPRSQMTADLIKALTQLYVGNPEAIEVAMQEGEDGSCYFAMRGDPRDDSRLIGRDGSHVQALEFLVKRIGAAQGRIFTFRLLDTKGRHEPYPLPPPQITYDTKRIQNLLSQLLAAIGVEGFYVQAGPGVGPRQTLAYEFVIDIQNRAIAESLTYSLENNLSVIGSIGTLVRTIGRQQGVSLQVRLADRRAA